MNFLFTKKIYLPALVIVFIVFMLLVFISISTYQNLNRDRTHVISFVHDQGVTLIKTLEAVLSLQCAGRSQALNPVETFIRALQQNRNVFYFYLIHPDGGIRLYASGIFNKIENRPKIPLDNQFHGRYIIYSNHTPVYELTRSLSAASSAILKGDLHTSSPRRPSAVVLGLNLTDYEDAQQADLQHAVIMAAIVIALGAGALFFLYVIQKYYRVDKTLRQTRDYANIVVENMAHGLLSIDLRGHVRSFNSLVSGLLDCPADELQDANLREMIDFDDLGIDRTLNDRTAIIDREFQYKQRSGAIIPLGISVTPITSLQDEQGHPGAVILLRDLTEIKRLQNKIKHAERLATIGVLAAGVAHEVRNPLSSVKGFAQFLYNALDDRPKEKEYAGIMVNEVDRINRVVSDLLTLARPQGISLSSTDIGPLIDHILLLIEKDAQAASVKIVKAVAEDLKTDLDVNQMTQALLNLLLNALQAVEPGGVITLEAYSDAHRQAIVIAVTDNGPGIDPAIKDKIFDPFYTGREKGTGLGLAIVQKIVADHNGDIRIESPPPGQHRGMRISLNLPMQLETPHEEHR